MNKCLNVSMHAAGDARPSLLFMKKSLEEDLFLDETDN